MNYCENCKHFIHKKLPQRHNWYGCKKAKNGMDCNDYRKYRCGEEGKYFEPTLKYFFKEKIKLLWKKENVK